MPSQIERLCEEIIARRVAPPEPGPLEWGGWKLDGRNVEAPRKMKLSRGKAALLALFIGSEGRICFFDDIAGALRCSEESVRTMIKSLRRDIGSFAIEAERGKGYRLMPTDVENPVDVLVRSLETALEAAKRIQKDAKR